MKYAGYLIDLDGTIYLGNKPIPAGKRFVERLQQRAIPFLFVTNNTTKNSADVADRLANQFDIHVSPHTVYTAGQATVDFILEDGRGKKVFTIGEAGLKELIAEAGLVHEEAQPDYVVVGMDRDLTYRDLEIATFAIRNGAVFVGTNPDKNLPTERGLIPGAGSINALIETATQQAPIFIGKPNAYIMQKAVEMLGLTQKEVIMVGDNYETDIQAGIQNQIASLLVLTGFTQREQVPLLPQAPTHILDSLDEWEF